MSMGLHFCLERDVAFALIATESAQLTIASVPHRRLSPRSTGSRNSSVPAFEPMNIVASQSWYILLYFSTKAGSS